MSGELGWEGAAVEPGLQMTARLQCRASWIGTKMKRYWNRSTTWNHRGIMDIGKELGSATLGISLKQGPDVGKVGTGAQKACLVPLSISAFRDIGIALLDMIPLKPVS